MHLAGIPPHDPPATPGGREGATVIVTWWHTHTLPHLSRSLGTLGYLLLCHKNGKSHIQTVH